VRSVLNASDKEAINEVQRVSHCRSETLLPEGSRQAESGRGLLGQAALNKELVERSSKHSMSRLKGSHGSWSWVWNRHCCSSVTHWTIKKHSNVDAYLATTGVVQREQTGEKPLDLWVDSTR
jgi:hypothetical protein